MKWQKAQQKEVCVEFIYGPFIPFIGLLTIAAVYSEKKE